MLVIILILRTVDREINNTSYHKKCSLFTTPTNCDVSLLAKERVQKLITDTRDAEAVEPRGHRLSRAVAADV